MTGGFEATLDVSDFTISANQRSEILSFKSSNYECFHLWIQAFYQIF